MSTRRTTTGLQRATTRSHSNEHGGAGPARAERALRVCFSPRLRLHEVLPSVPLGDVAQVGRDAAVMLADPRVSRVHCEVIAHKTGHFLRDLHSRNGTHLNGERLPAGGERALRLGDVLRVGDSLLVYTHHVEPSSPRLPAPMRGASAALHTLGSAVRRLGPSELTVLLLGETGAGKEVLAEALHRESGRPGAFVPVNASALPEPLAESELFGHQKGAFTGAASASPGLVQSAARGTLFLDEIGELPLGVQAKLLRVLDHRRVRAVGAAAEVAVDVRILAATNTDLRAAVAAGRFRADLYERLAEEVLNAPPLRERLEDVTVLLAAFLRPTPAGERPWTAAFAERLLLHRWPGNVRELRSVARRLVTLELAAASPFDAQHLGAALAPGRADAITQPLEPAKIAENIECAKSGESGLIGKTATSGDLYTIAASAGVPRNDEHNLRPLLVAHAGNVRQIAQLLGKERRQIYRWLARAGLDPDDFRSR